MLKRDFRRLRAALASRISATEWLSIQVFQVPALTALF